MKKRILFFAIAICCIFLVSCHSDVEEKNYQAETKITVTVSQDLLDVADIYVGHNTNSSGKSVKKVDGDTSEVTKENITKLGSCSQTFTYSGSKDDTVGLCILAEKKDQLKSAKTSYNLSISYSIDIKTKSAEDHCADTKTINSDFNGIEDALENILPMYCVYELDTDGNLKVRKEGYDDGVTTNEMDQTIQTWSFLKNVAVIIPEQHEKENFSKFLLDKSLNRQVSDSSNVETVVIFGKALDNPSEIEFDDLVKIAAKDGELIFLEINKAQFGTFVTEFLKSYNNQKPVTTTDKFNIFIGRLQSMGKDYVYFENDQTTYSLIAMRGINTFFITPENESDNNTDIELGNILVKWIVEEDYFSSESEAEALKSLSKDITESRELLDAQIVDDSFIAIAPYNYRNRQVPVHIRYYIWTAHNLDTGHEFYIVQQEVNAENQKWYCEIQDEHKWVENDPNVSGNHDGSYGPYQKDFIMENRIDGRGKNVVLTKYAPVTQSGSTTVTTGVTFNIGGNIGLSGTGPSGGFSGNITFANSKTESVPEVAIKAEQNGSNITWKYLGSDINLYERAFRWAGHTLAKGVRVNSMSVMNSWIWDVDNKNTDEVYYMTSESNLRSEALDYDDKFFSYSWWVYSRSNYRTTRIALNPPSRFKANYLLQAETPASWDYNKKQAFESFMIGKFKNWYSNMDIYSPKKNLDDVAKNHFDNALSTFEKNKDVIRSAGYSGTITFYIKNTAEGKELNRKTINI